MIWAGVSTRALGGAMSQAASRARRARLVWVGEVRRHYQELSGSPFYDHYSYIDGAKALSDVFGLMPLDAAHKLLAERVVPDRESSVDRGAGEDGC